MTLNDVSVTTLIMHWKPIEDSDEQYKGSISDVRIITCMHNMYLLILLCIIIIIIII